MTQTPAAQLLIGAHTSIAGSLHHALLEGVSIGATTVQLFTANQKQWHGKAVTPEIADLFIQTRKEIGMKKIMSHSSYLINLGSPQAELLDKSLHAFAEEIKRCHLLEIDYLNFHPGAATGSTEEECLAQIVKSLLKMEPLCAQGKTRLLLETTAGQGSSVGHRFEHLAYILDQTKGKIPLGICIDTCHIFVAGYDIRTKKEWETTLAQFDEIVGLSHLYAFHLNDSVKPLGSRSDRHAHLGEGEIGLEAFRFVMTHPSLRELPKYLETPKGGEKWTEEIALLRKMAS